MTDRSSSCAVCSRSPCLLTSLACSVTKF